MGQFEVEKRFGYNVLTFGFQAIIMSFLISINILVFCGHFNNVLLFLTLGCQVVITYHYISDMWIKKRSHTKPDKLREGHMVGSTNSETKINHTGRSEHKNS